MFLRPLPNTGKSWSVNHHGKNPWNSYRIHVWCMGFINNHEAKIPKNSRKFQITSTLTFWRIWPFCLSRPTKNPWNVIGRGGRGACGLRGLRPSNSTSPLNSIWGLAKSPETTGWEFPIGDSDAAWITSIMDVFFCFFTVWFSMLFWQMTFMNHDDAYHHYDHSYYYHYQTTLIITVLEIALF